MDAAQRWQRDRGARCIARGGVIAYPTEGVWGLGCDPYRRCAVERIYRIKQRPAGKGLILIAHDPAALQPLLAPLPDEAWQKVCASWPGAVTWVLPAAADAPRWLTGGRGSIAARVTAHPIARGLCERFGGPMVSTSANKSSHRPARSALQVRLRLGPLVDSIVPGATGGRHRPTPIYDAISGACLRP